MINGFTPINVLNSATLYIDHTFETTDSNNAETQTACATACLLDNHVGTFDTNDTNDTQHHTYYVSTSNAIVHDQPTYRAAGWSFDNSKCTLYTASMLPLVADKSSTENTSFVYNDMDCRNGGTRVSSMSNGVSSYYCLCNQDAEPSVDSSFFEGERCTVPISVLHTTEVHPSWNLHSSGTEADPVYWPSALSAAQHRWRTPYTTTHPSAGLNVNPHNGMPYPLTVNFDSGDQAGKTPPALAKGYSAPTSVSGQCGQEAAESDSNIGNIRKCNDCTTNCPASGSTDNVSTYGVGATGSATIRTPNVTLGTATGANSGEALCSTNNCSVCTVSNVTGASGACTSDPSSFKSASDAYAMCIAGARSIAKASENASDNVSKWSASQQQGLKAILDSAGDGQCKTRFDTSSGGGLEGWKMFTKGGLIDIKNNTHNDAVGCNALMEAATAISEFNATSSCVMNATQNCQHTLVCTEQEISASIKIKGNNDVANIEQTSISNINAGANYTTGYTNQVVNSTQQSMDVVQKQLAVAYATIAAAGSLPIASGQAGSPAVAGAHTFADFAATIANITNSATSNQINNQQVTNVVTQSKIDLPEIKIIGDNDKVFLKQSSSTYLQVTAINQSNIDNSLSNATDQILTVDQDQTSKALKALIPWIVGIVVIVIVIAICGAFVPKIVRSMHKNLPTNEKLV
jgi:hypothetical protein